MIQWIQIDIGPELRCKIADGQTAWAGDGKQVVTRKIHHIVDFTQYAYAALQVF